MGPKTLISKGEGDQSVELPQEVKDYIEKLEGANAQFAANETVLLDRLSKAEEAAADPDDDDGDEDEIDLEEVLKSDDIPDEIKALISKQADDLKAATTAATEAGTIAKAERDARIEREMIAKAADEMPLVGTKPDAMGKLLKSAAENLPTEDFDTLVTVLKSANEQLKVGGIFKAIGSDGGENHDSDPMKVAVAKIKKDEPGISDADAIAKAVEADPSLYRSASQRTNKEG